MFAKPLFILAAFLLFFSGCCFPPNPRDMVFPIPPDFECETTLGSLPIYEVAVWECFNGEHIVAWRSYAEYMCTDTRVEKVACGELSYVEKEVVVSGNLILYDFPVQCPWSDAVREYDELYRSEVDVSL